MLNKYLVNSRFRGSTITHIFRSSLIGAGWCIVVPEGVVRGRGKFPHIAAAEPRSFTGDHVAGSSLEPATKAADVPGRAVA